MDHRRGRAEDKRYAANRHGGMGPLQRIQPYHLHLLSCSNPDLWLFGRQDGHGTPDDVDLRNARYCLPRLFRY